MEIQFNKTPLVIEENSYPSRIVNVYIIYDLDNWPKTPLRTFTAKKMFFERLTLWLPQGFDKSILRNFFIF